MGNNRIVANQSAGVIQSNQYYPFGMLFAESTGQDKQDFKYNGKELDQMHGLNQYDYSARYYDPAISRFTTMDPHAENYFSWSPYAYVGNNPMRLIDPSGMDTINVNGLSGLKDIDWNAFNSNDDVINVNLPEISVTSNSKSKNNNDEFGWYDMGGKSNWAYALGALAIGEASGSFRLTSGSYNGNIFSPHYYRSGWRGGSRARIQTYSMGQLGKALGVTSSVIGISLDAFGVKEYLENPNSPNAVSPTKFGVNLGVTAYASWVLPPAGVAYFGVESFYPGGFYQFLNDASNTQQKIDKHYGVDNPWTRPRLIPWGVK